MNHDPFQWPVTRGMRCSKLGLDGALYFDSGSEINVLFRLKRVR